MIQETQASLCRTDFPEREYSSETNWAGKIINQCLTVNLKVRGLSLNIADFIFFAFDILLPFLPKILLNLYS